MNLVGNHCDCDWPLGRINGPCLIHGEKGKAEWDRLEAAARGPQIVIRQCDDWVAVYKDGKRVWSTHSCSIHDGLEALGISFERVDLDDQLDDLGNLASGADPFPETLG